VLLLLDLDLDFTGAAGAAGAAARAITEIVRDYSYARCARYAITGIATTLASMAAAAVAATKCNQSQVKVKGVAAILTQKVCFKLALVEANTLFMANSVCCAIVFPAFLSAGQSQQRQTLERVSLDLSRSQSNTKK